MTQYSKKRNSFLTNNDDLYEVVLLGDQDGNIINTHGPSGNIPIADGRVDGYSVRNIFGTTGATTNIVTTEFRTPWERASNYEFPAAAAQMSLVSTSTSDTAVTILILGLDADYNPISEVQTLTGTTPITTTNSYLRINDMVCTVGNAVGTITLSVGANVYSQIDPGEGKDQKAVYTVPAGYSFFLTRIDAFCTDANGGKAARFRNFLQSPNGRQLRVADTTFFNNMSIMRQAPFKYDEKTDILMQLRSLSGSVFGSVFAEGILVRQ